MRRPFDAQRAVRRLAGPAIAQQLLHTLVFLADRAMLGRHGDDALASMQIGGPLVWSTYSVLGAFTVGSVALVGRLVGARDRTGAASALRASLAFALVLGFIAAVVGAALSGPIVSLFDAAGAGVRFEAQAYLQFAFLAMPSILFSYTGAICLQAAGDTRTPFLIAAAGNVVNVGLNYVFIFGALGAPAMGAGGAALASGIAMTCQSLALAGVFARSRKLNWRGRGGERHALARMIRVAVASLVERLLQHAGFLGFVAMITALGGVAMAANQALISIESIVFLSGDGFGIAAAAVVAQRLGAGERDRAAEALRAALGLTVVVLGAYALVFLAMPVPLLRLFSEEPHIVSLGVPCMYVAAAAAPFMGVGIVMSAALRGAGDTRIALGVTFVGGLVVRLSATWFFAFHLEWGLVGVWLGSTADWVVRTLLFGAVLLRGRWGHARV